jgi:oligosaccharide repeat unit polymerase
MFDLYLILTAFVILAALAVSYRRTRDPLSPLVTFTPMLFYVYVYHPYVIQDQLSRFLRRQSDQEYVLLVNLVSIAGFCAGAAHFRRSPGDEKRFKILETDVSQRVRKRFLNLSLVLATAASISFWWLVNKSGGAMKMLYQTKPFFASATGYIGELPMLTYPAILLLAAAWQGQRLNFGRFLIAFYVASPQIAWAVLGKRRGTIFLILAMLGAFWYVVRNKRPNWKVIIGGVGCLGLLLLFVAANRGSNAETLNETLSGQVLTEGDEFVAAAATILASEHNNHHFWGLRVFAMFLVRPIPSFFWESKWKDLGLDWMVTQPGLCGMTTLQWQEAVGFDPALGTAGGFVADAYLEWSWAGAIACYWLGFFFSWLWKKWVTQGGVWTAIYVEAMILTIYLPSQSLGAWAYRFALLAVPTAFLFRLLIPKKSAPRQVIPPMHFPVRSV